MSKLTKIFRNETKQRKKSITKLHSYLTNPGRFSVLLLGLRGTGKKHWLKKIQHIYKDDELNLNSIVFASALAANKKKETDWDNLFKLSNNGLLVISDIESLNKESQGILFEGISTGKGGKFGFNEKKYDIRIAFTSSKSISTLRDTETYLSHYFFDRICQFAVKLPSFEEANKTIWADFKKSWDKMCFEKHNNYPNNLKKWLETFNQPLHGNFRDLDKLAINWHNYRLQEKKEEDILNLVKSDFISFYHFPEHNSDVNNLMEISEDQSWSKNLDNFRAFYKNYLIEKYGSIRKGAKISGLSHRTIESW